MLKFLDDIGFTGAQEIKRGKDYVDILFEYGNKRYIVEIKIARPSVTDPLIKGIVQAYQYGLLHNTMNLIVINYPFSVTDDVLFLEEINERVLYTNVECIILTDNWYTYDKNLNIEEIFSNLKSKIDKKIFAVMRVESASIILQKGVQDIAKLLNKYYVDEKSIQELANHLTKDYGLFITLSNTKITKSRLRNQTIDLLAYILINQILFYFLYSKKIKEEEYHNKIPEIKKIRHINELAKYFDIIREIDFKPIFDIFVIPRIPSNKELVGVINNIIECLTPLKVTEMKQDIYGRLIGKSLPLETRSTLASYYTKVSSADLLTNLTIDNFDDTVWDLACGSGTLLVSSYDKKMTLYKIVKRSMTKNDYNILHKKFVENDLTGTDIMPFACHLTGLNFSAKNLETPTDFLRISTMNSLRIQSLDEPIWIEEAYGDISKELERLKLSQKTIDYYVKDKKHENIKPKKFLLHKVDRVVINPPFTSINKLPDSYRDSFTSSSLSKICGKRIHLWGHFLALTNEVLKEGGKFGAIIPISMLHGRDTKKIRQFYLTNYTINYIIKPTRGKYFSEDSNFKDIILIATKIKPDKNHKVKIICLKTDIEKIGKIGIDTISKNIKTELKSFSNNEDYVLTAVEQSELLLNVDNLMKYVFTNNANFLKKSKYYLHFMKNSPLFTTVMPKNIREGHQLRPIGTTDKSVFTGHYSDSRIVRSNLIFENDNQSILLNYKNKKRDEENTIEKLLLEKTMRTPNGINVINSTNFYDYILKEQNRINEYVHLIIPNRYQLYSSETYLTAFYFDDPICPMKLFMMYRCNKNNSKIMSLYFNSIFFLLQIVMYAKQSTRSYLHIKQLDMKDVYIPNISKLDSVKREKILCLFKDVEHHNFKSLPIQLEEITEMRKKIDITIAEILNITIDSKELSQLYAYILDHIRYLP